MYYMRKLTILMKIRVCIRRLCYMVLSNTLNIKMNNLFKTSSGKGRKDNS